MIIHLKKDVSKEKAVELARELQAVSLEKKERTILITPKKGPKLNGKGKELIEQVFDFDSDIQLANKAYMPEKRRIEIGELVVGGNSNHTLVIGGPCSIESREQIEESAAFLKSLGISTLRAGAFKSRTSPYTFQGLGLEGLEMLTDVGKKYGLKTISEVKDATHVNEVIERVDIVQIGARAMYNHAVLRACGQTRKPILIKRGFGSTLDELIQAAEFVLSEGNDQVMVCERGIRTFENKTRFTLDLSGAVYLKHKTNLPVFLDPSHGIGLSFGVPDLARACMAAGIEGLIIETHPNPAIALSDADQQIDHETFSKLHDSLLSIGEVLGRKVI